MITITRTNGKEVGSQVTFNGLGEVEEKELFLSLLTKANREIELIKNPSKDLD